MRLCQAFVSVCSLWQLERTAAMHESADTLICMLSQIPGICHTGMYTRERMHAKLL